MDSVELRRHFVFMASELLEHWTKVRSVSLAEVKLFENMVEMTAKIWSQIPKQVADTAKSRSNTKKGFDAALMRNHRFTQLLVC